MLAGNEVVEMRRINKKGNVLGPLGALGVGIAGLAIALVIAFLIIGAGQTQIGNNDGIKKTAAGVYNHSECVKSVGCNATTTLTGAVGSIPGWVSIVVIGIVGAVLLSIVGLYTRKK